MTGEVPPDDELADQSDELVPVDAEGAAEVPAGDAGLDEGDDLDADELDDTDDGVGAADDTTTPDDAAPLTQTSPAGTSATQRTGKPTGTAIVPDAKAVRAADDEHRYVDDRVSKYWIAAIVAVFALILLYGLLFGHAGMFSPPPPTEEPLPTDTPVPSLTAAPSPSAAPTTTAAPSITLAPTVVPSASVALPTLPTTAPSASPLPGPT
jgi:hypothetical protein